MRVHAIIVAHVRVSIYHEGGLELIAINGWQHPHPEDRYNSWLDGQTRSEGQLRYNMRTPERESKYELVHWSGIDKFMTGLQPSPHDTYCSPGPMPLRECCPAPRRGFCIQGAASRLIQTEPATAIQRLKEADGVLPKLIDS